MLAAMELGWLAASRQERDFEYVIGLKEAISECLERFDLPNLFEHYDYWLSLSMKEALEKDRGYRNRKNVPLKPDKRKHVP